MNKNAARNIGEFFSRFFMQAFFWLARLLPFSFLSFLGDLSGRLSYVFVANKRKVALESLKTAYPNKPLFWRKKVAISSFRIVGKEGLRLFVFLARPQLLRKRVKVVGEENLKQALAQKKGAIGLSAHFGNFPLMSLKLAQMGYKTNIMARPMRYESVGKFLDKLRQQVNIHTIYSLPRKQAVYETLKILQRNEVVIMQMDQNFGTSGVWVYFFGHLAATPVGPIVFSQRSGALLLPMFILEKNDHYTLYIEKAVSLLKPADKNQFLLQNAAKITEIFEGWIRKYPDNWSWIHRRWKSQPPENSRGKIVVQKI